MKQHGVANGDLLLTSDLMSACDNVAALITAFSGLGAQREERGHNASAEIELRQVEVFDELCAATHRLSFLPATTSLEAATVARIIKDLRQEFGYCGLHELEALSQSHERAVARLVVGEGERGVQTGWISRRLAGLLGLSDCTTQH